MSDVFTGVAYIAFAAACMARGLTPIETGNLWMRHEADRLPDSAMAAQIWLEEMIAELDGWKRESNPT